MNPPVSSNASTDLLFDKIANNLQRLYGYSVAGSEELARECYRLFQDQQFCQSIGFQVQDEEFFHHEMAGYMAMRAHYYLTLKADPQRFIEWVQSYMQFIGDDDAKRAFIGSLNKH